MTLFFTLASSSAGNSYYVGSMESGILIDCGISCRAIESGLKSKGISPDAVRGILVSHEHSDHIRGLKIFLGKHDVPVYGSEAVLKVLTAFGYVPQTAEMVPIDECGYQVGDYLVSPFHISHDSVGGYGYSVMLPNGSKLTTCTDTGYLSDDAISHLMGSNLVLIESNYEKYMLEAGRYPYSLKKRIEGPQGHISNAECSGVLPELVRNGTRSIILAHLSRENNMPDIAVKTAVSALSLSGFRENEDYTVIAAPRSEPSECFEL